VGVGLFLEAAIGIEPMNKGFAASAKLFAQDRLNVHTCIYVAIGSDPTVTQKLK